MEKMCADQKCKHGDPSSSSSIHIKKTECDDLHLLALGHQREIPEAHQSASLAYLVNSRPLRNPVSTNKEDDGRGITPTFNFWAL